MKPGDRAWLGEMVYVAGYDALAAAFGWETMSQAADRHLAHERHGWKADLALLLFYLHVANRVPHWCDPIGIAFDTLCAGARGVRMLINR